MEYKDFEEALQKLEEIVEKLERGDLALENALQLFEEGVKISQFCNSKLEEAEKKVTILLKDRSGDLKEQPFELTGNESDLE
ncbi:MAG TPA: exodeoxyribonuclease VII small subunit [Acidobacteriota bacterium]|nr:exodeoxyribonuclease VII small subunit [Acidobacteriota bacterium]